MSHLVRVIVLFIAVVLGAAPARAATVTQTETLSASTIVGGDKININTAGVKELMSLSGVGRSVAEEIVKYRDEHGLFKKPEDLRKVQGVGGGLWERNRERIVVK
jgi:competence protein ComEA